MTTSRNHVPSLFASILFVLGGLMLLGIALLMGIAVLSALFSGMQVQAQQAIFLVAFGFEALVLFTAAFFAFQKFLQHTPAERVVSLSMPVWLLVVVILLAGVSLGVGYFLEDMPSVDWLALPVLTVPAIVFPLALLLALGARKLPLGTRWQSWSVLGLAMTAAPFLLFVLEVAFGILILAGVVMYIMTQPDLAAQMQRLSQQMLILGPQSEAARELLSPFMTKPAVILIALLYISVIAPAIEEILKPLGVWLLAGGLHSPAQGFTLGALSGAGYALIETIGISGQQTAEWASLLSSRIGTGLLHITTSALMGAAIVMASRERRYLRLFGTYLLAVFLHGLWNALAVMFTFSGVAAFLEEPGRLGTIQPAMMVSMIVLAVVLFAILMLSNRKWRREMAVPIGEPVMPPATVNTDETIHSDSAIHREITSSEENDTNQTTYIHPS